MPSLLRIGPLLSTFVTKAPVQHSAVLIFLVVYVVLGITGKLPDTLDRINGGSLGWKS